MTNGSRGHRERRAEMVQALIDLRDPLDEIMAAVRQYEWDSEVELVQLTRCAAAHVLQEYLAGRLRESECQVWVEAVEGRDDIYYESGYEELLSQFLFELSAPEVTEPLSPAVARAWLRRLRQAVRSM